MGAEIPKDVHSPKNGDSSGVVVAQEVCSGVVVARDIRSGVVVAQDVCGVVVAQDVRKKSPKTILGLDDGVLHAPQRADHERLFQGPMHTPTSVTQSLPALEVVVAHEVVC